MTDFSVLGVVGAGPMGAGIAQTGLAAGLKVILFDLNAEALAKAGADILSRLARLVEKGQLPEGFVEEAKGRLTLADTLQAFAPSDVVVEAIIERLEPKQKLFAELEGIVSPQAILASNTSSLFVSAIAANCTEKSRVCGLHFFNPVPLMKLVEVITTPSTSAATIEAATALSKKLGKTPVTVKDGPGFLVNLQGRAYTQEALAVVQEGVTDVNTLDRIMREAAGFRMGPFELMDLTGIDVNFPATNFVYQGYQHDPRLKTTTLHELMFNAGLYGRKVGRGFHDYSEGVTKPAASETVEPGNGKPFTARIGEASSVFDLLQNEHGLTEGDGPILIAPIGEDATTVCHRLGLDPAKTVAIDFTAAPVKHLTLMTAPGGGEAAKAVAEWLRGHGFRVEIIKDSPGFVLQRMLGMIANLGCELAQIGMGTPEDIDLAMRLAQNYPKGPLEWGAYLGVEKTYRIMTQIQAITGSDRYRPSLWLRRRALLNLPIHQAD